MAVVSNFNRDVQPDLTFVPHRDVLYDEIHVYRIDLPCGHTTRIVRLLRPQVAWVSRLPATSTHLASEVRRSGELYSLQWSGENQRKARPLVTKLLVRQFSRSFQSRIE